MSLQIALPRPPGFTAVLHHQARAVRLALRREALVIGVAVLFLSVVGFIDVLNEGSGLPFEPVGGGPLALLGLIFAFAVWKGEHVFGPAHLWTLPVARGRHLLAKTLAGYGWLLAACVLEFLWQVVMTALTGGDFTPVEHRHLLLAGPPPADPASLPTTPWSPKAWEWLIPFGAATLAYLFGTAMALGVRYKLRWLLGAATLYAMLGVASAGRAIQLLARVAETVIGGRVGLDQALTAGQTGLADEMPGRAEQTVIVWRGMPDPAHWLSAWTVWAAAGLLLVALAIWRHGER